jgi:sulfur transfer complex TusBCD TusB component (DsrH family)
MKYNDPIERIRKVKAEIVTLTEMIRETDNIYVMQNCQLQINEYNKWLEECRMQNEYTSSRNGLLIAE